MYNTFVANLPHTARLIKCELNISNSEFLTFERRSVTEAIYKFFNVCTKKHIHMPAPRFELKYMSKSYIPVIF